MTRRTGLLALFAVIGQILRNDIEAKAQTSNVGIVDPNFWKPPTDLTVSLGAGGYKRFHFSDGVDTITFTALELMAALKESR